MSALREIQEAFHSHLLRDDPAITNYISAKTPEILTERIAIYNNAYYAGMFEALEADYSVLMKLMGEDDFFNMAEAYVKAYPSHYFSIDLFGQHLAEFLAKTEPYAEKQYLSELANFIWQLNSTIDAPDAPILTMEQVTAIPQENWGDMYLTLQPSAALVTAQWNILPIWQAITQDQPVPALEKTGNNLFVWRKDMQPYYTSLTREEAVVFQALQAEQTFGEICENLLQYFNEDQVATYAVNLLLRWLNNKMLAEVRIRG